MDMLNLDKLCIDGMVLSTFQPDQYAPASPKIHNYS